MKPAFFFNLNRAITKSTKSRLFSLHPVMTGRLMETALITTHNAPAHREVATFYACSVSTCLVVFCLHFLLRSPKK